MDSDSFAVVVMFARVPLLRRPPPSSGQRVQLVTVPVLRVMCGYSGRVVQMLSPTEPKHEAQLHVFLLLVQLTLETSTRFLKLIHSPTKHVFLTLSAVLRREASLGRSLKEKRPNGRQNL